MKPTTRTASCRRPEIEHKPTIAMPVWCRPGCRHLRDMPRHHRPHLLTCTWRLSPGKWCLGRIDRMTGCPLAENAQNRPVDGAVGEGDLPHAHEGKRPLEGHGSFLGALACGCFAPRQNRAENNYHLPENRMRSDAQCPTTKRG